MASSVQTVSVDELADLNSQCTSLHKDWHHFYQLAATPPPQDDSQRNLAFIQLRSRLSCDYPILSHWQKGDFGLASSIGKLVAEAGTLESFSTEVRKGEGPLVQEWKDVNDSIVGVRSRLEKALSNAKSGKPVKLPKEIAKPVKREPFPIGAMLLKLRKVAIFLVVATVLFFLLRPVFVHSGLFAWLDAIYDAWRMNQGLPDLE